MKDLTIVFDGNFFISRSTHQVDWTPGTVRFEDTRDQGVFVRKVSTDLCAQIKLWRPYLAGVVFGKDYRSFRHGIYPDYKGTRVYDDGTNYEIRGQLEAEFYGILEGAGGVICHKIEGAEADDVCALWKYYLKSKGGNVLIISADKDLNQLADDNCLVFNPIPNPKTKMRKMTMTPAGQALCSPEFLALLEKEKIHMNIVNPIEELFVKTVWGDKGDNIPNVKRGVGEKTAKKYFDALNLKYNLTMEDLIKKDGERYNDILRDLVGMMKVPIDDLRKAYERNLELVCLHPSVIKREVANDILRDIKVKDGKTPDWNKLTDFKELLAETDWVTEDEESNNKMDMPKSYDPFANLETLNGII